MTSLHSLICPVSDLYLPSPPRPFFVYFQVDMCTSNAKTKEKERGNIFGTDVKFCFSEFHFTGTTV